MQQLTLGNFPVPRPAPRYPVLQCHILHFQRPRAEHSFTIDFCTNVDEFILYSSNELLL